MTQEARLDFLIRYLLQERGETGKLSLPSTVLERRQLLRGLMNLRPPQPVSQDFLQVQDAYLQARAVEKGIQHKADLKPMQPGLYLWQGDITTLAVDGIVNAANSGMLGCFVPCHGCIDNAIHSFAGVQLRLECARLMAAQQGEEPTGRAKITKAYNLPSRYVLHTVGPIVYDHVTQTDRAQLESCYRACLELAAAKGLKSLAFCCISTGEFHFPNRLAAKTAVETVQAWQQAHPNQVEVIFNVFKELDRALYGNCSQQIERLQQALDEADAVVLGAGAGLSTSAGFCYTGARFAQYFEDFIAAYGFRDMYSGGFYPFDSLEEHWAYWSRYIYINRYMAPPKPVYDRLYALVREKDYFVLTTNVDHCFQKAGFDKHRLFYTQGDYGLWQCSKPCHQKTYDNETAVRKMLAEQKDRKIPSALVPHCPVCGAPMAMNLRADDSFVEDEGWHAAASRYQDFLRRHEGLRVLYLELGVGGNTPVIIKYPFWRMTAENPKACYACVNRYEAVCPQEIRKRAICLGQDIGEVLEQLHP